MKYYAIADLHGRHDLLLEAVDKIYDHAGTDDYKIITLGDYIDRGPDSNKIIEYLMKAGDSFVCIQGNHEAMMVETLTTPLMPGWWVGNGGDTTLQSYGWGGEPYSVYSYDIVPKSHVEWITNLPLYFETEKQVFVHAGIPDSNMNLPPSSNTTKGLRLRENMQWMLYDKTDGRGWRGKHVVHGHHQFEDGPHVWHGRNGGRTDLDTYAWKTGRLVVGVFDDTQGPAKEFIEVKL
jgi:serine/threonine protein phosphatase 1